MTDEGIGRTIISCHAPNIATGAVQGSCGETRTEEDFVGFIKHLIETNPGYDVYHFVSDQLNTNKSESLICFVAEFCNIDHEFFDKPVVYPGSGFGASFALSLQHGQDLGAEDLFQFFELSLGEAIKGPVRSKVPVCDDGVKIGMKPGVIPECVDQHDHPQDPVIEAQDGGEEHCCL